MKVLSSFGADITIPGFSGRLSIDEPMSAHTSYRIGGPADLFAEPDNVADLQNLLIWARSNAIEVFMLGAGSNLLVSDSGIRGLVIQLGAGFSDIHICGSTVVAGASARIGKLVKMCLDAGLTGVECLACIPGSIGGAVFMNAGTPSGCIGDNLQSVRAIDADLNLREVPSHALGLRYRGSDIGRTGLFVLEATFSLKPGDVSDARRKMDLLVEKRKDTQPTGTCTAGSVFKNPPGGFAGRLLEAVGAKGMRVGAARVSQKHANFIENAGNASAQDVRTLIKQLQSLVVEKFAIELEPEIQFVGEWK